VATPSPSRDWASPWWRRPVDGRRDLSELRPELVKKEEQEPDRRDHAEGNGLVAVGVDEDSLEGGAEGVAEQRDARRPECGAYGVERHEALRRDSGEACDEGDRVA